MITAVVTSDNHLGAYYARLKPERLAQRRKRLQEAFARVVDAAIGRKADLFLHAGDLFDRPDPRNVDRHFVACQFKKLQEAGIPVFAIAGNHDSPRSFAYDGSVVPLEEMDALNAVHLFRETDEWKPAVCTIRGHRVAIWGLSSDFNRADSSCPLEGIAESHQRAGDIDLLLLHYSVEGWGYPSGVEPCLSIANLERSQADAICVGHLHSRQETRLSTGAALLNPGSTEHINFGEEKLPCGFWVLHCEPGNVKTEYVALTPQRMHTLELDLENVVNLTGSETTESAATEAQETTNEIGLMHVIGLHIKAHCHADQLLRVRLTGRVDRKRFQEVDLSLLQELGQRGNFYCQLETDRLTIYDPLFELPIGYGVSFDVKEELWNVAQSMIAHLGDNETEQDICRQATDRLNASYDRFFGTRS